MQKIYFWTKTLIGKIITIITSLVALMTLIDYLLKWQIYSYLFDKLSRLFILVCKYPFELFILICLIIITVIIFRIRKEVKNSKLGILEKELVDAKNSFQNQIKKSSDSIAIQIKSIQTKFENEIFDIKRTIIDFEIEKFRDKGQVGEISRMIEKLEMDIKAGFGAEETLPEIREYVKKSGMPNYYLDDLHKVLKNLPESLKRLGEETLKLAEEKLYSPRKK